jgi:hypothetical protein
MYRGKAVNYLAWFSRPLGFHMGVYAYYDGMQCEENQRSLPKPGAASKGNSDNPSDLPLLRPQFPNESHKVLKKRIASYRPQLTLLV